MCTWHSLNMQMLFSYSETIGRNNIMWQETAPGQSHAGITQPHLESAEKVKDASDIKTKK